MSVNRYKVNRLEWLFLPLKNVINYQVYYKRMIINGELYIQVTIY